MPGRSQRRVAFILVGGILLTGVIVLAVRSWRVTRAVAVIESCGGAISADELWWPYIWGPHLVTFDLPGLRPIVKDSDGPRLAQALANLPRLERLILANNSLGDEFFTAIAPSVSIEGINLSDSRCSDDGVRALIRHRSARWLQIEGLTLSAETRKLLAESGIEQVPDKAVLSDVPNPEASSSPAPTISPPSTP